MFESGSLCQQNVWPPRRIPTRKLHERVRLKLVSPLERGNQDCPVNERLLLVALQAGLSSSRALLPIRNIDAVLCPSSTPCGSIALRLRRRVGHSIKSAIGAERRCAARGVAERAFLDAADNRLLDNVLGGQAREAQEGEETAFDFARADAQGRRRAFAKPEQLDNLGRADAIEHALLQLSRRGRGSASTPHSSANHNSTPASACHVRRANWSQESWAEVKGYEVTMHNVRNCDYRTETDYTPRWETRTVRLSQLTGIDLAINYWGSPWMAHPIASFQFANAPPLCFARAFLGLCFTRVRPVGFNDEPGEPLVRQDHPEPLECSAETVARQDQELDVNEGPSQFGEQPGLAHAE